MNDNQDPTAAAGLGRWQSMGTLAEQQVARADNRALLDGQAAGRQPVPSARHVMPREKWPVRIAVLHSVAKALGLLVHVEGFPFGSRRLLDLSGDSPEAAPSLQRAKSNEPPASFYEEGETDPQSVRSGRQPTPVCPARTSSSLAAG